MRRSRRSGPGAAPPVTRWVDRPPGAPDATGEDGAADRAAALFRRAEPVSALGAATLARVRQRMRGRSSEGRGRARVRALASALVLSGAVLFGTGGLVLAAKGLVRLAKRDEPSPSGDVGAGDARTGARASERPKPAPPAMAKPAPPAPPAPPATSTPAPPPPITSTPATPPLVAPVSPTATPTASPTPPPAPEPPRSPVRERVAPARPVPEIPRTSAPATTVAEGPEMVGPLPDPALDARLMETQLLGSALRKLRHERDPAGALRLLDEHHSRFPAGALAAEATVARIDALLALGRRQAALQVLDGVSLTGYSRRRELLVLRGELQTEAGDCADALLDLDLCARVPAGDQIEERAIYGKAVCLARLGQRNEASVALQGYLRRFPRGRFVKPALESLLEERP